MEELCNNEVLRNLASRLTEKYDTVIEQPRINIIAALAAGSLLDNIWNEQVFVGTFMHHSLCIQSVSKGYPETLYSIRGIKSI